MTGASQSPLAIYIADHRQDPPVTFGVVADVFDRSPASVTEMCQRLGEQGLVVHEPYQGVTLTEAGRERAEALHETYVTLSWFLRDVLELDDCETEAVEMAGTVSADVTERLGTTLLGDGLPASVPEVFEQPARTEKPFTPHSHDSHMIVPGSDTQALAARLAEVTGDPLAPVEFDRFPDGEGMARIGDAVDDHAVVVASTVSDAAHIECLQLQDAAHEAGASQVTTVLPYMGYARQDRSFEAGEPVSARAVARAVSTGTDRVLTVEPHEPAVCAHFGVPATAVDAAGVLADPLPADLTDPLFLSPDAGAVDLAATVADAYGRGDTDYFEKKRLSGSEVEITPSDAPVADRDVVLVDDIVATGTTMSESVAVLNDRAARSVYVTCVHPLLASNAVTKLSRAGVEAIYGTDTIERPVSAVSVAPAIADAL